MATEDDTAMDAVIAKEDDIATDAVAAKLELSILPETKDADSAITEYEAVTEYDAEVIVPVIVAFVASIVTAELPKPSCNTPPSTCNSL